MSSEPESESEVQTTSELEANAEIAGESEPENATGWLESEPEAAVGEPVPKWPESKDIWKAGWPLHVYAIAIMLLILAILSIYSCMRYITDTRKQSESKRARMNKLRLPLSLNILVCIFCTSRGILLLVDAYGFEKVIPTPWDTLLFAFGWPCLTGSNSLLMLVMLETTKVYFGPPVWRRGWVIGIFVLVHFILVTSSEIFAIYVDNGKIFLLVCQSFFFIFYIALAGGYFYVGAVIRRNVAAGSNKTAEDKMIAKLTSIIFACGVASAVCSIIHIYAAFGVFGVLSTPDYVDPWSWWVLQTLLRLSELVVCSLILSAFFKTENNRKKTKPGTSVMITNSETPMTKFKKDIN